MSKVSFTTLIVLSAALAACSNDTDRAITAPDIAPARSETSADLGASYTLDGLNDAAFASQDAFAGMAGAEVLAARLAASAQAASGSRASGHVGFPAGVFPPASPIVSEKYSFVALSTASATPLSAKGQFEVSFTSAAGGDIRIHGDVTCMITFGNTARVSGQITKVWRNNVPSPITTNTHAFWVVVDNGEGAATTDQVSLMRFSPAAVAQNFCTNGFGSVVFPNQEGDVQVR